MSKSLLAALLAGLIASLTLPAAGAALEFSSLLPEQASPGSQATLIGGPFGPGTTLVLGERTVEPTAVSESRLSFTVPPLEYGEYALLVREGEELRPTPFTLRIVEPTPRIVSLSPSNIDQCSTTEERTLTIEGWQILPGAQVMLEGAVLGYSRQDEGTLSFIAPPLAAGTYAVQVVNPAGSSSLPRSLYYNNVPEIHSATIGEDFVNYYRLIIEGKNFTFNSTLVVNEYQPGFLAFELPPRQKVIPAQGGAGGGFDRPAESRPQQADSVQFVDCRTLVYNRYPYSFQQKELTLQVVNPDGKATEVYRLAAP